MGFGQIKHLLPAGAHAHAEKAARADGQQGLHQVVARIGGIGERIQKGQQTAQTVRLEDGQGHGAGAGQDHGEEQIDEARAPGQTHEEQNAGHHHGAAEVGLQQQQAAEQARHGKGRDDAPAEGLDQCLLGTHEIGQIQGQGDLDELHGLQVHGPQWDPALGAVDGRRQGRQGQQEQEQGQEDGRILQFVEPAAGHEGRAPEHEAPAAGKNQLALEKVVFVTVDLLGHDTAGRQHHDEADGQDDEHQGEQPPVEAFKTHFAQGTRDAPALGSGFFLFLFLPAQEHVLHARLPTMRLKSLPRST